MGCNMSYGFSSWAATPKEHLVAILERMNGCLANLETDFKEHKRVLADAEKERALLKEKIVEFETHIAGMI
jgi:hypothetical protein